MEEDLDDGDVMDLGLGEGYSDLEERAKEGRSGSWAGKVALVLLLLSASVACVLMSAKATWPSRGKNSLPPTIPTDEDRRRIEGKLAALEAEVKALKGKAQQKKPSERKMMEDIASEHKRVAELLGTVESIVTRHKESTAVLSSLSATVDELAARAQNSSAPIIVPLDLTGFNNLVNDKIQELTEGLDALRDRAAAGGSGGGGDEKLAEIVLKSSKELQDRLANVHAAVEAAIKEGRDQQQTSCAGSVNQTQTAASNTMPSLAGPAAIDVASTVAASEATEGSIKLSAELAAVRKQLDLQSRDHIAVLAAAKQKCKRECRDDSLSRVRAVTKTVEEKAQKAVTECLDSLGEVKALLSAEKERAQSALKESKAQCAKAKVKGRRFNNNNHFQRLGLEQDSVVKVDFALPSAGAVIVHRNTSQTYIPPNWRLQSVVEHVLLFNGVSKGLIDLLPLAHVEKHFLRLTSLLGIDRSTGVPEDAISRDVSLGSCWPMDGQRGYITILLQQEIMVESISIQHVSRQEATDIRSAPHEFSVFGARDDDGGPGDHLLEGAYSINGPAKQTFHVKEPRPIRSIKVDISSNHGHLEYTCLYKVAVHGVLF